MSVLPLVGAKNRSKWLYVPLQRRRKGRKSPSVLRIPHKMTQSTLILQEVTLNLLPTVIFFLIKHDKSGEFWSLADRYCG